MSCVTQQNFCSIGKKSKSVSKTVYNIVKANFELVAELHLSCKGISSLSFDRENDKLFVGTAVGSTVIGMSLIAPILSVRSALTLPCRFRIDCAGA